MKKLFFLLLSLPVVLTGCASNYQASVAPVTPTANVVEKQAVVPAAAPKDVSPATYQTSVPAAPKPTAAAVQAAIPAVTSITDKTIETKQAVAKPTAETVAISQPAVPVTPVVAAPLSNDNTYTNVDGNEVHSPVSAPSVPVGASAVCGDGTYSFSQNRRGTCSHHGGVAEWL